MSKPLKIYFPVESVAGLGHLNRAGQLVRAMVEAGMEVTVASGTFVDPERFFPGAKIIHLPDYVHRDRNGNMSRWNQSGQKIPVSMSYEFWQKQREQAHRKAVRSCQPDVTVIEFWPFSRRHLTNEVNVIHEECRKLKLDPLRICSVRDVIKGKVPQAGQAGSKQTYANERQILRHLSAIDAVIIHGDEALISLDKTFSSLSAIGQKIFYSGYVVADLPQRDSAIANNQRPVLIHGGSGSTAEDFFIATATAWGKTHLRHLPWHFVTGPRLSNAGRERLFTTLLQNGNVRTSDGTYRARMRGRSSDIGEFRIDGYRGDLLALMANCALSVSLAGYNTTLEVFALRARAILVPKFRVLSAGKFWTDAEQEFRLAELHRRNLVHTIDPAGATNPYVMAKAMQDALDRNLSLRNVRFDGARNTASLISHLYNLRRFQPKVA